MIYLDDKDIFKNLKDENGLSLCKVWFLTKLGKYSYNKKIANELNKVILTEVSPYKLVENEILLIGNTYAVGNGKGTVIYSPCRENTDIEGYKNGTRRITKKYEVSISE